MLRFGADQDAGWLVEFAAPESTDRGSRPEALTLRFGFFAVDDHGPGCVVPGVPAMFADVEVAGDLWRLRSRRPLRAGRSYTACVEYFENGEPERSVVSFDVPPSPDQAEVEKSAPRVVDAWPGSLVSAEEAMASNRVTVPANLLRLYLWFDQPMRPRDVAEHLELRDDVGRAIADALVAVPDGLWDGERRRLTVFLHPGRIKRGVGPRAAQGPAVREGAQVALHVRPGLRSSAGVAMAESAVVQLDVGQEDRRRPEPRHWRVATAPSGGRAPLTLLLDEPLDREIVRRLVRLEHEGEEVAGIVTPSPDGKRVQFVPEQTWQRGRYRLLVSKRVEDLAGNSVDRLFDLDTGTRSDAATEVVEPSGSSWVTVPFEIE